MPGAKKSGSAWKRTPIGSILKSKDAKKPSYLKVNLYKQDEVVLRNGSILQVESKTFRLQNVALLREEGNLPEETIDKIEERANNMPDFVLAEVILVEKN